jgi:Family of unknown function (DUF6445)
MSFTVVDDFTQHAERVRASALEAGFGTWRPNKGEVGSSIYDGMCFWGEHGLMLFALGRAFGQPIIPNSMFFRVTNLDTEAAYVHSDREAGEFTAIVYLSEHDEESGTGFYKNRRTGLTRMPPFAMMRNDPADFERLKQEMVDGDVAAWELLDFVRGRFNRCVIFDAPLFHARHPKNGFAASPEGGRMVWVCHFTTAATLLAAEKANG